ncbi:MAG: site-2 protease family protein, partial [Clostridiales bacterium]|nr:site-2 protease family protein [Clostridiales bacterium]
MVVFFCLPVHEFAHAYTASRLGDPTPRAQGRLTLNPMAHLSPMGTLMIFLVGIGFAKPVQINMRNFKKPRQGMAMVALAGPVSNLIMSFLSVFCYYFIVFLYYQGAMSYDLAQALSMFFGYVASVNIWLAIFNLIPIPPLDGSRILNLVLPARTYYKLMEYEQYIM